MSKYLNKKIVKLCAYSHIYQIVFKSFKERKLPEGTRQGATITLLGIFCPFFWISLFSGASHSTKLFHATHSGIVILIGIVTMIIGAYNSSKKGKNGR
jgi:hypothetical protein